MADGDIAPQAAKHLFIKDLGYQPHFGMDVNPFPISGGDPGALLTAVLEGKQTKEGEPGYILTWGINAEKSTTLLHFSIL